MPDMDMGTDIMKNSTKPPTFVFVNEGNAGKVIFS